MRTGLYFLGALAMALSAACAGAAPAYYIENHFDCSPEGWTVSGRQRPPYRRPGMIRYAVDRRNPGFAAGTEFDGDLSHFVAFQFEVTGAPAGLHEGRFHWTTDGGEGSLPFAFEEGANTIRLDPAALHDGTWTGVVRHLAIVVPADAARETYVDMEVALDWIWVRSLATYDFRYQQENTDCDGDGLSNDQEARYGSNPFCADTNGDGIDDLTEVEHGWDPADPFEPLHLSAVRTPGLVVLVLLICCIRILRRRSTSSAP